MKLGRRSTWMGAAGACLLALAVVVGARTFVVKDAGTSAPRRDDPPAAPPAAEREASGQPREVSPDPVDSTRLAELRAVLTRASTESSKAIRWDKENAPLFSRLAAESKDPKLVLAALGGMQATYGSRPSSKKSYPDEAFDRALIENFDAEDTTIAVRALGVAPIALMSKTPSQTLTSKLIQMAGPKEPAARRQAALEALSTLRPDLRNEDVLRTFETALLGPEPQLIAIALYALEGSGPSLLAAPAELRDALSGALALALHPDAGVRGRALALFAALPWVVDDTRRSGAALAHLGDPEPYVRAEAANLLARARRLSAVHPLMPLTGDLTPAHYVLRGFVTLDGNPGELRQRLAGRATVADAAQDAVRALSALVPGVPFPILTTGSRIQTDADIVESANRVRAWYDQTKHLIPKE